MVKGAKEKPVKAMEVKLYHSIYTCVTVSIKRKGFKNKAEPICNCLVSLDKFKNAKYKCQSVGLSVSEPKVLWE